MSENTHTQQEQVADKRDVRTEAQKEMDDAFWGADNIRRQSDGVYTVTGRLLNGH